MRLHPVCLAFVLVIAFLAQAGSAEAPIDSSKVLVVLAFDQNCKKWCTEIRPLMEKLKQQYHDSVAFAELDFTPAELPKTKQLAKDLGLSKTVEDVGDNVPEVLVFASKRRLMKEILRLKPEDTYRKAIDEALQRSN